MKFMFMVMLALVLNMQAQASAQECSEEPIPHVARLTATLQPPQTMSRTCSPNLGNQRIFAASFNFPQQPSSEKKEQLDTVPIYVFGLVGTFSGMWVGHNINHKEHMPGEPPEIFTKGTLIGASLGLAAGAILGYFLGKRTSRGRNSKAVKKLDIYNASTLRGALKFGSDRNEGTSEVPIRLELDSNLAAANDSTSLSLLSRN